MLLCTCPNLIFISYLKHLPFMRREPWRPQIKRLLSMFHFSVLIVIYVMVAGTAICFEGGHDGKAINTNR